MLTIDVMRGRDPDDPFDLDSADLERLMVRIRGAEPAAGPLIRGRLREFQKRFFPKAANAGRGNRATYDMRETLRVALAFELIDLDLSSPRCIVIVQNNGRAFDRLCLAAWQAVRMVDAGATQPGEVDAERRRLTARVALSAATHEIGAFTLFATSDGAAPPGWPGRRSRITIDVLAVVTDMVSALEGEAFRFLPREVDEAFVVMGEKVYGTRSPSGWRMPVAKPNDDRILR